MGDRDVDDGQDVMQCNNHPYTNNGGICALCLQEKLGRLITSSTLSFDANITSNNHRLSSDPSPTSLLQQHSSSSSPPITIEPGRTTDAAVAPIPNLPRLKHVAPPPPSSSSSAYNNSKGISKKQLSVPLPSHTGNIHRWDERALSSSTEKKMSIAGSAATEAAAAAAVLTLKRSKSVAAKRGIEGSSYENSPRRSFWSFLYFTRKRGRDQECSRRRWDVFEEEEVVSGSSRRKGGCGDGLFHQQQEKKAWGLAAAASASSGNKENESPNSSNASSGASFGRKVARSRSVGCGSGSFSGDFLERISNGFADCTLRRVESHREAKAANKIVLHGTSSSNAAAAGGIKESVKCGGIFGGFGIYSSSSYWLSDDFKDSTTNGGRLSSGSDAPPHQHQHQHYHGGRYRSWSWAFSSPMRVFSRPSRPSHVATTIQAHAGGGSGHIVNIRNNSNGQASVVNSVAPA